MVNDPPPGPRAELARWAAARGEDLSGLSRLLGRNPAYIQQFVRRGVPRKLDGDDRRTLARYLRIDEALLGGEPEPERRVLDGDAAARASGGDLILVPRLEVEVSAGPGAVAGLEEPADRIAFSARFLREVTGGRTAAASVLRVTGDSMAPTLGPGDDILVVARQPGERLRDGIHVLRVEEVLLVKRLMVQPDGSVEVISDNPLYPRARHAAGEVTVIGRVVWAARRL